jgi:3-hydroxyisobutyrate dehydrogenase-like beta-hydroxyacid dehydrogenase
MGVSVAASAKNGGHQVYWVSAGRSSRTIQRATGIDLHDMGTLSRLCRRCDVIISVCPPDAAETVADQVLDHSFAGLYLDANAISPERAVRIGRKMARAGVAYVDGGIIGGPAWEPGHTWLYLSGKQAQDVAALFSAGPLETEVIGDRVGKASALKMCFAANTKGTTALLCAILAAAERLDVRKELERQWSRHESDFADQAARRVRRVTAKAWRFAGEMDEIAATLAGTGVPGDFHAAASILYRRMAHFKDAPSLPPLEAVLAALAGDEEQP